MKRIVLLLLLVAGVIAAVAVRAAGRFSRATVDDRLAQFGATAAKRWEPYFKAAGLVYPPPRVAFIGLKQEKQLEVYAATATGAYRFVRSMPILAASGGAGPKLREGDRQVPEGLYPIESLNPNSSYHLSLRIGYPNADDRRRAKEDGRNRLGGDIMIHGKEASIGCLAMGDEGAEDLFVLAAQTGLPQIRVLLVPADFRRFAFDPPATAPSWTTNLYATLRAELAQFPASGR